MDTTKRRPAGTTDRSVAGAETDLFSRPVDVRQLLETMDFSSETLAQALLEQGKLMLQASQYRIQKMRVRMEAEARYNELRLELGNKVRSAESETRITEKYIEEQVNLDKGVQEARKVADDARLLEEWSKLVRDAFQDRGSMAKALVQLIGAEAAVESGFLRNELERMGVGKLKDSVKERFPFKKR